MILTSGQIKRLRAEGHRLKLKPLVMIGQKGLSESLHAEIEQTLAHHELLKLRIPAFPKADKKVFNQDLCKRHRAQLVESIGNVIVIYRCNTERDRYASIINA